MYESDASFSCFRQDIVRNTADVIPKRVHGVNHYSFCRARVRALALERDRRGTRAPCFLANFTELPTIDGVSELGAEALHVELLDTCAYLFVGRESDRYCSVFDLG